MKSIVLCCFLLTVGITATVAQTSPMNGVNNTNCSYLIELVSVQGPCTPCPFTMAICVPTGSFSIPAPCGPGWVWDRANITPVIDSCLPCGSPVVSINVGSSGSNCLGLPLSDTGTHCAGCQPFTATNAGGVLNIN